jgi:hypothetical protein
LPSLEVEIKSKLFPGGVKMLSTFLFPLEISQLSIPKTKKLPTFEKGTGEEIVILNALGAPTDGPIVKQTVFEIVRGN